MSPVVGARSTALRGESLTNWAGDAVEGRRRRTGILVAGAVAAVVLQVVARLWVARSMTYYQDDWRYAYGALESPLNLDWVLSSNNGYFAPLGNAVAWFVVRLAPFDYTVSSLVVTMLGVAVDVAAYRCLVAYFGRGRLFLVLFVSFLASTLFVVTTSWWTVGVSVLPAVGLVISALRHQLIHVRTGSSSSLAAIAALLSLALCFTPKAAVSIAFLAAWMVVGLPGQSGSGLRGRVLAARGYWVTIGGVCLVWACAYGAFRGERSVQLGAARLDWVVRESLLGTFLPSVLGGPWGAMEGPQPPFQSLPSFVVLLVAEVLLGVVAWIQVSRHPPVKVWVPISVMTVANLAALTWTASGIFGPDVLRQGRYWADLAFPLLLSVGLAWSWRPRARPAPSASTRDLAAVIVIALLVQSAAYTILQTGHAMHRASGGTWLANAQRGLAENPQATINDSSTPKSLVDPVIFPELGVVSQSLRYWVTGQRFDEPSSEFMLFDGSGALVPAEVAPTTRSVAGPVKGCGYLTTGQTVWIPLEGDTYPWRWAVTVNYLAKRPGVLELRSGADVQDLPVEMGPGSVSFVTVGDPQAFYARSVGSSNSVCIDSVEVGNFVAAD